MGTRARINVIEDDKVLVSIYRQYDGYPEGLGQKVADFLRDITIVNGLSGDTTNQANGMGCLAAQLIKYLKDGVGSVYIRSTGPESQGEEYIYTVYQEGNKASIRVSEGSMTAFGMPGDSESEMNTIFDGPAKEFPEWVQ